MSLKVASPAPDVLSAMILALTTNAPLQAILATPGAYSGRAPNLAVLPYIVVADATAAGVPTFDGRIGSGTYRLNLWAKDLPAVMALYAAVGLALDGVKLDLGAAIVQTHAQLELTATIPDPSVNAGVQGVVSYEWSAQVVA